MLLLLMGDSGGRAVMGWGVRGVVVVVRGRDGEGGGTRATCKDGRGNMCYITSIFGSHN